MSDIPRRDFLLTLSTGALAAAYLPGLSFTQNMSEMYGLIGKIITKPGERDALIAILLEGTAAMPGCLSYVISKDPEDENVVWITEFWDSQSSHEASLSLPNVQEAIAQGRELIEDFGERFEMIPVGGHGLGLENGQ